MFDDFRQKFFAQFSGKMADLSCLEFCGSRVEHLGRLDSKKETWLPQILIQGGNSITDYAKNITQVGLKFLPL